VSGEGFRPRELAPGLWRWTAAHPEWHPNAAAGSTGDWGPAVGSVLCVDGDWAAFIDALAPASPGFWDWADTRVAGVRRCSALTTIGFHRRSRDELVERYGADTSRARDRLPPGVEKVALRGAGEVAYWLPAHGALVLGDRIIGAGAGRLALCPPSWIRYLGNGLTHAGLRERLRPLLELPVERVLVAHGEPVLSDGRAALAELLG
jgi:hypothetical protein